METLWYCLVAILFTGYFLLDGFDFGAGALHLFLAKSEDERTQILASIGPFWDGNEVWLVAAGGTLFFAFPSPFSSAFSGFYLPFMVVLWLLLLRGIAIESRHMMHHPLWGTLWDTVFCGASGLLAIVFGAAVGNLVRGFPLDADGEFFLAFFTDFGVSGDPGIFDWYTLLTGLLALVALLQHGALWIAYRTHEPLETRARTAAGRLWYAAVALTPAAAFCSYLVRPALLGNFAEWPLGAAFPLIAIGGLAITPNTGFRGSCIYIGGILATVAFILYPKVLAAAPLYGLQIGLVWWVPAFLLACGYTVFVYSRFSGKVDKPGAT